MARQSTERVKEAGALYRPAGLGENGPTRARERGATEEGPEKIRVSLDISPELYAKLQTLSRDIHGTKSDVLRKSIALMDVAVQAKKQGKKIGLADRSDQLTTEIIGFEY